MSKIIIFSLEQWVRFDINSVKNRLFDLAIEGKNPPQTAEEVWAWFKNYVPKLCLESSSNDVPSHVLNTVRVHLNKRYDMEIDTVKFLENFNAASKMTPEVIADIEHYVDALISGNTGSIVLLVARTNHLYLQSVLTQLEQFAPRIYEYFTVLDAQSPLNPNAKILIATSMHTQKIDFCDIVQATLPTLPIERPWTILSFLANVVTLEGYPKLEYRNPGKSFQHFYQVVTPKISRSSPPIVCTLVFLLEDFIPENRNKMIESFISIMLPRYLETRQKLINRLTRLITDEERFSGVITAFKQGKITQQDFVQTMIEKITAATAITLSPTQFEQAWKAKNPSSETMQIAIKTLCDMREKWLDLNIDITLISDTNPLDMGYFMQECQHEEIALCYVDGVLARVGDISVQLSYPDRLTKSLMLKNIVSFVMSDPRHFHFFSSNAEVRPTIVYVSTARDTRELDQIIACNIYVVEGWDRTDTSLLHNIEALIKVEKTSICCVVS